MAVVLKVKYYVYRTLLERTNHWELLDSDRPITGQKQYLLWFEGKQLVSYTFYVRHFIISEVWSKIS